MEREDGIPEPKFSERTGGLEVTFKFKEPISPVGKEKKPVLTARQEEILSLLVAASLNGSEITHQLKNSPSVRTVQRDLLQLERIGLFKREGKARMIFWKLIK